VENIQENRVQQEEPVYAEVHQEDPDAIGVVPEEPEVTLEATPDVVSQAGGAFGDCVAAPQASPPGLDPPRAKAIPAPHRARREHRARFCVHRGLS
jgi:hypothetical protein